MALLHVALFMSPHAAVILLQLIFPLHTLLAVVSFDLLRLASVCLAKACLVQCCATGVLVTSLSGAGSVVFVSLASLLHDFIVSAVLL